MSIRVWTPRASPTKRAIVMFNTATKTSPKLRIHQINPKIEWVANLAWRCSKNRRKGTFFSFFWVNFFQRRRTFIFWYICFVLPVLFRRNGKKKVFFVFSYFYKFRQIFSVFPRPQTSKNETTVNSSRGQVLATQPHLPFFDCILVVIFGLLF